jgi:hypothetical protein
MKFLRTQFSPFSCYLLPLKQRKDKNAVGNEHRPIPWNSPVCTILRTVHIARGEIWMWTDVCRCAVPSQKGPPCVRFPLWTDKTALINSKGWLATMRCASLHLDTWRLQVFACLKQWLNDCTTEQNGNLGGGGGGAWELLAAKEVACAEASEKEDGN